MTYRDLFKSIGDFWRPNKPVEKVKLNPAEVQAILSERERLARRADRANAPATITSSGTFEGLKGDAEIEAIVAKRLKQWADKAGMFWRDDQNVEANLTSWFLGLDREGR